MYGHHRSIRLPIYGAKVFATRTGTVDMHGCDVVTWTQLAQTANAGDNTIVLEADITQALFHFRLHSQIYIDKIITRFRTF